MKIWNAENIKQLRQEHKLSQKALGKLLGVSRNYIAYLERGERTPSKTLLILLGYVEETLRNTVENNASMQELQNVLSEERRLFLEGKSTVARVNAITKAANKILTCFEQEFKKRKEVMKSNG